MVVLRWSQRDGHTLSLHRHGQSWSRRQRKRFIGARRAAVMPNSSKMEYATGATIADGPSSRMDASYSDHGQSRRPPHDSTPHLRRTGRAPREIDRSNYRIK
jgi:hypothetical protein